jgi:D-alanine-D-alanine ligase
LPPTEIIPKTRKFFDYQAKYDSTVTDEITPAKFPESINRLIQKVAVKAHKILGCRGISRTDMIISPDKKIYILETNTIPGMTSASLIPKAAQAVGISFSLLLDKIIQSAFRK